MSAPLILSANDRVLVFAPHPDDESIACGGLLLAARAAGAARRVVIVTDGDNNPWPQRWVEKRWRIDSGARARWGARRRREAHGALDVLGVAFDERFFLGLPDTALTASLMGDAPGLSEHFRDQIERFRPTHIALPALEDRHPDHSAAHIAVRFARNAHAGAAMTLLAYSVHGEGAAADTRFVGLSEAQQADKQRAILQHETQMRLSRKRFLGFATSREDYFVAAPDLRLAHPLRANWHPARGLSLQVDSNALSRDTQLLIAADCADDTALRWRLPIAGPNIEVSVSSTRTDGIAAPVEALHWRRDGQNLVLGIRLPGSLPALQLGYVKLTRRRAGLVVYDRYGWQRIESPP